MEFIAHLYISQESKTSSSTSLIKEEVLPGYWAYKITANHWLNNSVKNYYIFLPKNVLKSACGTLVVSGDTLLFPKKLNYGANHTIGLLANDWKLSPYSLGNTLTFNCWVKDKTPRKHLGKCVLFDTEVSIKNKNYTVESQVMVKKTNQIHLLSPLLKGLTGMTVWKSDSQKDNQTIVKITLA